MSVGSVKGSNHNSDNDSNDFEDGIDSHVSDENNGINQGRSGNNEVNFGDDFTGFNFNNSKISKSDSNDFLSSNNSSNKATITPLKEDFFKVLPNKISNLTKGKEIAWKAAKIILALILFPVGVPYLLAFKITMFAIGKILVSSKKLDCYLPAKGKNLESAKARVDAITKELDLLKKEKVTPDNQKRIEALEKEQHQLTTFQNDCERLYKSINDQEIEDTGYKRFAKTKIESGEKCYLNSYIRWRDDNSSEKYSHFVSRMESLEKNKEIHSKEHLKKVQEYSEWRGGMKFLNGEVETLDSSIPKAPIPPEPPKDYHPWDYKTATAEHEKETRQMGEFKKAFEIYRQDFNKWFEFSEDILKKNGKSDSGKLSSLKGKLDSLKNDHFTDIAWKPEFSNPKFILYIPNGDEICEEIMDETKSNFIKMHGEDAHLVFFNYRGVMSDPKNPPAKSLEDMVKDANAIYKYLHEVLGVEKKDIMIQARGTVGGMVAAKMAEENGAHALHLEEASASIGAELGSRVKSWVQNDLTKDEQGRTVKKGAVQPKEKIEFAGSEEEKVEEMKQSSKVSVIRRVFAKFLARKVEWFVNQVLRAVGWDLGTVASLHKLRKIGSNLYFTEADKKDEVDPNRRSGTGAYQRYIDCHPVYSNFDKQFLADQDYINKQCLSEAPYSTNELNIVFGGKLESLRENLKNGLFEIRIDLYNCLNYRESDEERIKEIIKDLSNNLEKIEKRGLADKDKYRRLFEKQDFWQKVYQSKARNSGKEELVKKIQKQEDLLKKLESDLKNEKDSPMEREAIGKILKQLHLWKRLCHPKYCRDLRNPSFDKLKLDQAQDFFNWRKLSYRKIEKTSDFKGNSKGEFLVPTINDINDDGDRVEVPNSFAIQFFAF
jgi:hypothetical protein